MGNAHNKSIDFPFSSTTRRGLLRVEINRTERIIIQFIPDRWIIYWNKKKISSWKTSRFERNGGERRFSRMERARSRLFALLATRASPHKHVQHTHTHTRIVEPGKYAWKMQRWRLLGFQQPSLGTGVARGIDKRRKVASLPR